MSSSSTTAPEEERDEGGEEKETERKQEEGEAKEEAEEESLKEEESSNSLAGQEQAVATTVDDDEEQSMASFSNINAEEEGEAKQEKDGKAKEEEEEKVEPTRNTPAEKVEAIPDDDVDDDDEMQEVSLTEYIHSELTKLVYGPAEEAKKWRPFIRQTDAVIILGEESKGILPPLEWKIFRKAYSLLFWIRPIVGSERKEESNTATQIKTKRMWYRFSTAPEGTEEGSATESGICVQCGDWTLQPDGYLTSTLTAYGLSPKVSSVLFQTPLHVPKNEWSLIGFTHNFPYLKRPQWTVSVNGTLQGRGEVPYPVVDIPMTSCTILSNLCHGGINVVRIKKTTSDTTAASKEDFEKSASELNATTTATSKHDFHFQMATMALHPEVINSDLQALLYVGGVSMSLQQGGKIVTPLPPIENWTKGSSLEGPNVGIPLSVHPLSLQAQQLQDKVVHAFSSTSARVIQGRIVLSELYLPGDSDATPKVGLLQPSVVHRFEPPTLHFLHNCHLVHALSDFMLQCGDNGQYINVDSTTTTPNLSTALQEQGLLPALIVPFFLAQLPAGHGLDLQKNLLHQSLEFLYKLYSNNGAWAASLIGLLADAIQYGGARVQEQVLQGGVLHNLASCLRRGLLRAHVLNVFDAKSSSSSRPDACPPEPPWWRPTHEEACPPTVPLAIAQACAHLIAVCCGVALEVDFSPATRISRSSDLALSAVFGLALNLDLWGKSQDSLLCILSQVSWRYGNVQGGQILRRQLPLQSLLDLLRSRLEFATVEIAARLSEIIQHMLLASLSHRKNISIGEHDVAACMGALCDLPLGSVGTHVILSSLYNILIWCNSEEDEHLIQIASRMGRNLIMSQYHDVVAPMLLSRTVFCGERSMSCGTNPEDEGGAAKINVEWEHHWRMALTLFAWVTSISGPEGGVAAQSTGSLLLASGLAGSLKNCLVDSESVEESCQFIHTLFLPAPSMSLMIGPSHSETWTYSELLSDRLQVMMPLLPGFVMSLVHNDGGGEVISHHELKILESISVALAISFHRIFGGTVHSSSSSSSMGSKNNNKRHDAASMQLLKAAKDYIPHLVLVTVWLEYHICQRRSKDNDETPVVPYKVPQQNTMEGSWVDVTPTAFHEKGDDDVLDPQWTVSDADNEVVTKLSACQKQLLSTVTDLLSSTMSSSTDAASTTHLWRSVVATLKDATNYTTPKESTEETEDYSHNVLCRLAAICLTKVQRRHSEWELWSPSLSGAVARLCDLVEEKELMMKKKKKADGAQYYSRDQILLECALLNVLAYGREMTGWCQLILPTPPKPPQPAEEEEDDADETLLQNIVEPTDGLHNPLTSPIKMDDVGGVGTSSSFRKSFVPPEMPGASSKLLLPVLQPCFRVAMKSLGSILEETNFKVLVVEEQKPVLIKDLLLEELKHTLIAAIVGLSFWNARDVALQGMASMRQLLQQDEPSAQDDDDNKVGLGVLLQAILEEIRVRYEGERRRREQALFDAYEEDDDGAAAASREVERMILGGDLIPEEAALTTKESSEEITFDTHQAKTAGETTNNKPSQDFVMFHEDGAGLENMLQGGAARLGWDQYKGLGAALEECSTLIKASKEKEDGGDEVPSDIIQKLLMPFLDTWDASMLQDAEDSEVVGMYDDSKLTEQSPEEGQVPLPRSETAADAMSTYIEMASVEKSRLSDYVNTFLPSHRYSCQAYAERYCWSRYFEIVKDGDDCGMEKMWERGIADGNRDIRSRLVTMPCNPQFKRYIPKYLDHGNNNDMDESQPSKSVDSEDADAAAANEDDDSVGPLRRTSVKMEAGEARRSLVDSSIRNLVETGNLEIVDITKKEIAEDELPELLTTELPTEDGDMMDEHSDEDIYGDGSLGFPSRSDDAEDEVATKDSTDTDTATATTDGSQSGITATRVANKDQGSANHHIASSIYSHPPDNSSSILSLLHSSAPHLIEKHFDNCLHVKAEGSRKCTILLSTTHLILEYDSEAAGLFEGELMAVREEAERQRLIEEAGGASEVMDRDGVVQDKIQELLERRQKEMAAMRPKSIRWNLSELSHVYLRRYRLRDSALEMFFIPSGGSSFGGFGLYSPATSLFLDFGSGSDGNRRRDDAAHAVMRRSPPQTIKQWPDRSGQFLHEQLSRLTMGWVEGRITNFDYLLHLNMLAGRSYNDLCQYPVMPWVLSNYTSEEIPDLTDRANFRDLTKPVGALNPKRLQDFVERFDTFADPTIPPFMYGSHYSTSAGVVLHFLVRMHPFAGLHRQLQGGYFDVADRLFSSVPRTWDMCTGYSAAEVKELTPEWYCNPGFLKNTNRFKLGTSQDGELLGDVTLPPWAKKSPEMFVEVMRNALESDICSDMLPDWIDLIFGRKQQGPEAIKAHNVFFYLTYYGSVDVAAIEDAGLREATELQIAHFGQCPMQLFVRSHVHRVQKTINFRKLTFYQMLSAYTQGAEPTGDSIRVVETNLDGSQRVFGEPLFLPFFSAPASHWIHLDAPPPGPHADLIAIRLAGVDRCLAIDGNGIFHSFRWAWKPSSDEEKDGTNDDVNGAIDKGNFVAQRELPRFKTVPRLIHTPASRDGPVPAVVISKTLFASRSVLLVLSDGDGRGGLAMQLVDPAKASVKGEALVPGIHSARITCVAMDPIGTAAGHGGVGGELAIVGSADGGSSLWRFMSSHYLPLRPRIRMRGHGGSKVQAVALSSAIHICASVSQERCCIFSIGNGAMIRSWPPPTNPLSMLSSNAKTKTVFCDTPALGLSVQGFVVTVCKTSIYNAENIATRHVISLNLFSLEGVALGSKALESWRGVPHKITCTPDGTAITVCSGRGVTIHRISAITPLEFIDEWHITETDELDENTPAAWDVDFGPSLMRPIVAASGCSSGVLRLHALPGISPWSERHKKSSMGIGKAFSKPVGRIKNAVGRGFGFGKAMVGTGKEVGKEVTSEVKERGVGGFLAGTIFRGKPK